MKFSIFAFEKNLYILHGQVFVMKVDQKTLIFTLLSGMKVVNDDIAKVLMPFGSLTSLFPNPLDFV